MKLRLLLIILLLAVIVFAGGATEKRDPYAQARDFPRGPLVYVQANDLPALIKAWNTSELKSKYLNSQNFADLKQRHLGLKLASRWQEFCDAAGFSFDLETIAGFANNNAAFALYDVGRLDFVFIAPVSDEVFALSQLMSGDKFEQEDLENGVTIYRVSVDADRGRQKQGLLFTHLKGRLIVATSEDLVARTVANLSGDRKKKDRLTDEPSFAQLKEKLEPHTATVWIDQAALGKDYYFKRYWLMGPVDKLKNIKAALFDVAIDDNQAIEHRAYLATVSAKTPLFTEADRARAIASVPDKVPFVRIDAASPKLANEAIEQTISINRRDPDGKSNARAFRYESTADYGVEDPGYYSLGEKFDENINETEDLGLTTKSDHAVDLSRSLSLAAPKTVTTFARPEVLPAPMFAEFHRGAVFELVSPAKFDRSLFESQMEEWAARQVTIPAAGVKFGWETVNSDGAAYRTAKLPLLDWEISYALRGDQLILANDEAFIREILDTKTKKMAAGRETFSELTMIDIDSAREGFDKTFERLDGSENGTDFFSGNVGGLVEVFSNVSAVEIKKGRSGNLITEDLTFSFRPGRDTDKPK